MAKTKQSKPKKDSVFDAEDFDIRDDAQDESLDQEEDEPSLDEIPDVINEDELIEEPIEPIDLTTVAEEEELDIIDQPENVISLDHLAAEEEEKVHEDTDVEAAAETQEEAKSVVIKCPHCLEEVLDMEICPLCGHKLRTGADQLGDREDAENILDEYADFSDEGDYPRKNGRGGIDETEVDLFGGLPYQDQYAPISSDSI